MFGRPTFITGEKCKHCPKKLRPKSASAEEHPGTHIHAGRGLCAACYEYTRRNPAIIKNLPPQPEYVPPIPDSAPFDLNEPISVYGLTDPELRDTAQALLHWVTARRRRGIPTAGAGTQGATT